MTAAPRRPASRATFVAWVLALYAACRVVTLAILWVVMQRQVPSGMTGGDDVPVTYFAFTALWDGQWYERIAEGGYPDQLPLTDSGRVGENPWAFYPLFPLVSRAVMAVTGLDFPVVGSTLALLFGFGAAVIMGLLLRERIGDPAAYAVVVLWASFPASVSLQLAYTESLAMLLLVAYLLALSRQRWLVATGIALLVGLSRPIAVPLGLVTLVVVLVRWRRRVAQPISRGEYLSMGAALLGCGVSGLLWPAIAWWRTGVRTAYTDTMSAWRGSGPITPFEPFVNQSRYVIGETGPMWLAVAAVLVVLMVSGPWARALGPDLRTWSLAYPVYVTAFVNHFTSVVRYLVPLFPLLVVLIGAGWSDRRGNGALRIVLRTAPVLILFVLGQYWWTDALWRFDPPTDVPP